MTNQTNIIDASDISKSKIVASKLMKKKYILFIRTNVIRRAGLAEKVVEVQAYKKQREEDESRSVLLRQDQPIAYCCWKNEDRVIVFLPRLFRVNKSESVRLRNCLRRSLLPNEDSPRHLQHRVAHPCNQAGPSIIGIRDRYYG